MLIHFILGYNILSKSSFFLLCFGYIRQFVRQEFNFLNLCCVHKSNTLKVWHSIVKTLKTLVKHTIWMIWQLIFVSSKSLRQILFWLAKVTNKYRLRLCGLLHVLFFNKRCTINYCSLPPKLIIIWAVLWFLRWLTSVMVEFHPLSFGLDLILTWVNK